MNNFPIWLTLLISVLLIVFFWYGFYKLYMHNAINFYNKYIIDFKGIGVKKNSSIKQKLLWLFFNRQQTYEYSGYAVLFLTIVFLGGGIAIFIFSNKMVIDSGIPVGDKEFWIYVISLRIGICVIVFFICQILLKLYRYCVKFAVFYIGLFDSLMLYEELNLSLKETMNLLMPKIDIGESSTPISDIAQILANVNKGNPTKPTG